MVTDVGPSHRYLSRLDSAGPISQSGVLLLQTQLHCMRLIEQVEMRSRESGRDMHLLDNGPGDGIDKLADAGAAKLLNKPWLVCTKGRRVVM